MDKNASEKSTFSVRRAKNSDRLELSRLWITFLEEQSSVEARVGVAEDAETRWLNDFPVWLTDETVRIFVALAGEKIVGFIVAQRWAPPPIYAEASEVYIDEIFVKAEQRRGGIGAGLLSAVEDWARSFSADRLRMNVLEENVDGLRFWKKQRAIPFSRTLTIELQTNTSQESVKQKKIGF